MNFLFCQFKRGGCLSDAVEKNDFAELNVSTMEEYSFSYFCMIGRRFSI